MKKDKKFFNYMNELKNELEQKLKEMGTYDKYPEKFYDYVESSYRNLAVAYRYFGEEKKPIRYFRYFTTIRAFSTRLDRVPGRVVEDPKALLEYAIVQLQGGIYFDLSHSDQTKAYHCFEWAAENSDVPDRYIKGAIKYKLYDDIAVPYLWRGYALINLEKYEEAYELLPLVIPYFNKYKKTGGEIWRKVEYALPKALIPLCEYKLNTSNKSLANAQDGLEEYINSFKDNRDKLEGYLYYFHLKEKFPDIYKERINACTEKKEKVLLTERKIDLPDDKDEGAVIIFDIELGSLEVFGTNGELEKYVELVKKFKKYPTLVSLMEIYAMEQQQDPKPLVEEGEKLLARNDVDEWIKEKTELVLEVARESLQEETTVMLYYDPEIKL